MWTLYEKKTCSASRNKKYDSFITDKVMEFFEEILPSRGFECRDGQLEMACDICDAIIYDDHLLVEAEVGIGKSFAYLVPLILLNNISNKPVIISTSTILLQEQLVKDINDLKEFLGVNPDVVLGKGMTHFKCYERAYKYFQKNNPKVDPKVKDWILNPLCGDRAKANFIINEPLWQQINVKNCKYSGCRYADMCPFMEMRKSLKNTTGIILCNHDLLTVNLKKRAKYERALMSSEVHFVVIDEAHNLEEKVRGVLKEECNYGDLIACIKMAENYIKREGKTVDPSVFKLVKDIYGEYTRQVEEQSNRNLNGDIERYRINSERIRGKIGALIKKMEKIDFDVQIVEDRGYGNYQDDLIERIEEKISFMKELINNSSSNLFWIELRKKDISISSIVIIKCPKSIDDEIERLFFLSDKRFILTSATLTNSSSGSDEERYAYITKTLSFPSSGGDTLSTPKNSPYDYDENAILYYRNDLSHPTNDREKFLSESVDVICDLLDITQGKTLILFTAKRDMMDVYEALSSKNLSWNILVQTEDVAQDQLISEFKRDENSILLGSGSYWEGVNIKGRALSNVIIFRLPFPVHDPVIDQKRSASNNPLMEVDVPEMLIRLKQGCGRLIRSESDKGIVTILDSRINDLSTRPYKDLVWNSIPIKNKTTKLEDIKNFVKRNNIVD